jgi:hypothetical protein
LGGDSFKVVFASKYVLKESFVPQHFPAISRVFERCALFEHRDALQEA